MANLIETLLIVELRYSILLLLLLKMSAVTIVWHKSINDTWVAIASLPKVKTLSKEVWLYLDCCYYRLLRGNTNQKPINLLI